MKNIVGTPKNIVGIAVKTTNERGQSAGDIQLLWQRFFSEGILEKIPAKRSNDIWMVYTDYEGDYTKPYTAIIGCEVTTWEKIPQGMFHKTIPGGDYAVFDVQGTLPAGVIECWQKIWQTPIARAYKADYEHYCCNNETGKMVATVYVGLK